MELPELTLKNEEQYRLWRELRRVDQNVRLHLQNRWADRIKEDELVYELMGIRLTVHPRRGKVLIQMGKDHREVSLADLRFRPKKLLNMIERWRKGQ